MPLFEGRVPFLLFHITVHTYACTGMVMIPPMLAASYCKRQLKHVCPFYGDVYVCVMYAPTTPYINASLKVFFYARSTHRRGEFLPKRFLLLYFVCLLNNRFVYSKFSTRGHICLSVQYVLGGLFGGHQKRHMASVTHVCVHRRQKQPPLFPIKHRGRRKVSLRERKVMGLKQQQRTGGANHNNHNNSIVR